MFCRTQYKMLCRWLRRNMMPSSKLLSRSLWTPLLTIISMSKEHWNSVQSFSHPPWHHLRKWWVSQLLSRSSCFFPIMLHCYNNNRRPNLNSDHRLDTMAVSAAASPVAYLISWKKKAGLHQSQAFHSECRPWVTCTSGTRHPVSNLYSLRENTVSFFECEYRSSEAQLHENVLMIDVARIWGWRLRQNLYGLMQFCCAEFDEQAEQHQDVREEGLHQRHIWRQPHAKISTFHQGSCGFKWSATKCFQRDPSGTAPESHIYISLLYSKKYISRNKTTWN